MKNFERRNAFYYDERDVGYDDDEKRERERECVCGGGLKVVVVVADSFYFVPTTKLEIERFCMKQEVSNRKILRSK